MKWYHNWSALRILRLALGVMMLYEALFNQNYWAALIGGVLLWQAYSNQACCGTVCNSIPQKGEAENKEIYYERISD